MADPLAIADAAVAKGEVALALALLRQHLEQKPTLAGAAVVAERVARLGPAAGLRKLKTMFLRSYTVEPVLPLLRAGALLHGLDLDLRCGAFNAHAQEALDPGSELYRCDPDLVFVA